MKMSTGKKRTLLGKATKENNDILQGHRKKQIKDQKYRL